MQQGEASLAYPVTEIQISLERFSQNMVHSRVASLMRVRVGLSLKGKMLMYNRLITPVWLMPIRSGSLLTNQQWNDY